MRRIIFTLFTILSLLLASCQFMHYNDNESLGNEFYFVKDGNFSSIIKSEKKEYKGIEGTEVIPPLVTDYNFNDSYIVAKTKDEKQLIKYWIVEKSNYKIESPLVPLDSIQFYKILSEKNINLIFKK